MKSTRLFIGRIAAVISAIVLAALLAVPSARAESLRLIRTPEVVAMMSDGKPLAIFDANNAKTRTDEGIVPGAKLLPSTSDYDTAAVLPQDKGMRIVFYCANEMCTWSHTAANRAVSSGYTNVFVMADGIQGWRKAGQKTTSL
jgi:rhodanese-related sulfurtransferase